MRSCDRSGYHCTRIGILDVRDTPRGGLELGVIRSEIRNLPAVEEEDTYRLTLENGAWRIDP